MKALRFLRGELALHDIPVPDDPGEALVRVLASGICKTDIEIVRGYAGFEGTMGHEFVGIVERANDRPEIVGKRVVGEINAGCGECERCISGDQRHCPRRTVLGIVGRDGAHAEYLPLPSRNLFEVPDAVTDDQAVFTEPLAAACAIVEQVDVEPQTAIAVVGDGKLGLLCTMTMSLRSGDVTLIGRHTDKLAIGASVGARAIRLQDLTPGLFRSFDLVIEASGSEAGFSTALDLIKPRGKLVLKSTFHGSPTWEASRIVVDEITVIGSRCGRFSPALGLLAAHSVPVEKLISSRFPLSDGVAAFRRAEEKGVLKVLLSSTA